MIKYADKKRNKVADKRISTYLLGFFENDTETEALLQRIKVQLTPQASVALDSYSGTAQVRAFTQKLGVQNIRSTFSKEAQDRTLNLLKFDTSVPEGRFHNRAVRVEVQEAVQ